MPDPTDPGAVPISEWLYVNAGLVWATRRQIEAVHLDSSYSPENQVVVWLVTEGSATIQTAAGAAFASKGTWMFPGSRPAWQNFQPGSIIVSLRFFAEWPTGKPLFDHREPIVLPSKSHGHLTKAGLALESMVRRVVRKDGFFLLNQGTADVESYFAIRQAFENWMLAYVKTMLGLGKSPSVMTETDSRVLRAARLMDRGSLRQPLKETDVAKAAGLSVSQLNRLFLRDLAISPKRYLQRRRLQAATLLLQHDRRTIKETAYELGFNSISNFSNWFYRQKGVFPRAFQRS